MILIGAQIVHGEFYRGVIGFLADFIRVRQRVFAGLRYFGAEDGRGGRRPGGSRSGWAEID